MKAILLFQSNTKTYFNNINNFNRYTNVIKVLYNVLSILVHFCIKHHSFILDKIINLYYI